MRCYLLTVISFAVQVHAQESLREAELPEQDDASLLQVALTGHQLDEAETGPATHDFENRSLQGQNQSQDLHQNTMGDLMRMMKDEAAKDQALLNHDLVISQPAEALMMKTGDKEMVIVGLMFVCVAILAGLFCICVIGTETGEVKGRMTPTQSPSAFGTAEPKVSSGRIHGKQPNQGVSSPWQASKQPGRVQEGSPGSPLRTQPAPSATQMSAQDSGELSAPGSMQGLPLCPSLLVPDGTRLACVVKADLKRQKQSLSFQVRSVSQKGGSPIFRVDVQELSAKPAIFLKALDGTETLAYMSTEELWNNPEGAAPALSIYRANGVLYGSVQKNAAGGYTIMRGQTALLIAQGDFQAHTVQAKATNGRVIAATQPISPAEYQVNVQSRVDFGLVLLALLAADKLESGYSEI